MTAQASISFDQEYARVVKAAQTANDLAHHRYLIINACMAALKLAGITNDAPLDQLVARLAGERDEAQREAEYWRGENRATRDAAARTMEDALMFIAPAAVIECERNNLKARVSSLQTQLEHTQRERDEMRARVAVLERKIDHYLAERDISDLMHDVQIRERDAARLELATLRAAHAATIDEGSNNGE